jgi:hypothetical protein
MKSGRETAGLRFSIRYSWVAEFLSNRGYEHMIARLKDLLNVEWR